MSAKGKVRQQSTGRIVCVAGMAASMESARDLTVKVTFYQISDVLWKDHSMKGTLHMKTLRLALLEYSRKSECMSRAGRRVTTRGRDESEKNGAERGTGHRMFWLDKSLCSEIGLERVSSIRVYCLTQN